MSYYEQLLQDSGFLRGITNEVPNSSEAYSEGDFLARFEKNIEARNEHVKELIAKGQCQPAS